MSIGVSPARGGTIPCKTVCSTSENGTVVMDVNLTKEFKASNLFEVLELMIREGSKNQSGIADSINEFLSKNGIEAKYTGKNISDFINKNESLLRKIALVIEAIDEAAGVSWLAEFLAAKHDKVLMDKNSKIRKGESGFEE